jgi:anti-anti-sigma factor
LLRLAISRPHATVAVVHAAGEIDASTAPELRALLNTPPAQTVRHMLLDLSGVTFLSAAGLSVLIAAQRRADTLRHALSLVTGPHCVDRALQITGLQDQFTYYRSLTTAVRACLPPSEDEATVVSGPAAAATGLVGSDGHRVGILQSYPCWQGLQLHSLVRQIHYRCSECERPRDSTMAATRETPDGAGTLVCPACYGRLTGTPRSGPPSARRAPPPVLDVSAPALGRYVAVIAAQLGLPTDRWILDSFPVITACLALRGHLPEFPDCDAALIWDQIHGWYGCVESAYGQDLTVLGYVGPDLLPAPSRVVAFATGLLAGQYPGQPEPPIITTHDYLPDHLEGHTTGT